jgi:hypothetical protein
MSTKLVAVRVQWDTGEDGNGYTSTVYVPKDIIDAHEFDNYEVAHVEEWLSNTFGFLVVEWEVVK